VPFKKFRRFSDRGSAAVEFVLLFAPTLTALGLLVLFSQYLIRSAELRVTTFEAARALSAVDPASFDDSPTPDGVSLSEDRFLSGGLTLVSIASRFESAGVSPLSVPKDVQVMVAQVAP
jgi:hypothetical protein